MSNIVAFNTHPAFEGEMATTLEGFFRRVKLWMNQRNGIDDEDLGRKYFDRRLDNLLRFAILAKSENLAIEIKGQRHAFDEEGNSFAYTDFVYTIPHEGLHPEINRDVVLSDPSLVTRCAHYFYQLSAGGHVLDWDYELRELMEESIHNADVECIIGNLLMMVQLPGINLVELIDVVRRKLAHNRVMLLMDVIEKTGTFYVYDTPAGRVLSITSFDFECDGVLTPIKPVQVCSDELVSGARCREVAKYLNRTTYALHY